MEIANDTENRTWWSQGPGPTMPTHDTCYACAQGVVPAPLMYGNTRASRAKVDKRYAADPRFV